MTVIVLDQPNTQLALKDQQLTLKPPPTQGASSRAGQRRIALSQLDTLILHPDTQVSAKLLRQLSHAGVRTMCLDSQRYERSLLIDTRGGFRSGERRLHQYQLVQDPAVCMRLARSVIQQKAQAQMVFLRALPKQTRPIQQCLEQLLQGISAMDAATSRGQLCGFEGNLQRQYFSAFFQLFPPSMAAGQRSRRPPKDPVNALLSLGYTLLYSEAVSLIQQQGLDPYLGIYHQPEHGRYSLACDIMEPARVCVDRWVWQLVSEQRLANHHFIGEGNATLLNRAGKGIFYAQLHGQKREWRDRLATPLQQIKTALLSCKLPALYQEVYSPHDAA